MGRPDEFLPSDAISMLIGGKEVEAEPLLWPGLAPPPAGMEPAYGVYRLWPRDATPVVSRIASERG